MKSKLDEKIINLVSNSEEEQTNNSEKENLVSNSEETKTRVEDSDSEEQNRSYFRVFDGSVDIMYRPASVYKVCNR